MMGFLDLELCGRRLCSGRDGIAKLHSVVRRLLRGPCGRLARFEVRECVLFGGVGGAALLVIFLLAG